MTDSLRGIEIKGNLTESSSQILTAEALRFVADLEREFRQTRKGLLQERAERQKRIDAGEKPDFLSSTKKVREDSEWRVAEIPKDLQNLRIEITGPTDRKMMINAFNSGANVFMADFEDANSPTWQNVIEGQKNLIDAIARTISLTTPEGKQYSLKEKIATLVVRPRGWHLQEKHMFVDGEPVAASLFDAGLYFFHNVHSLLQKETSPYFYIPKLESHLEARLWNDAFQKMQDSLGIPRGTIRATVLIETVLAAFEMEEILYELRDHITGLNAGRWDYIFSIIKKFRNRPEVLLPDRAQITMTVPFMRAYTKLLVKTCHSRSAHAIGGMAAFIPSRKDPKVNETALARVREDKERECEDGFDGTWVAHPDLVSIAAEPFHQRLGEKSHQKDQVRSDMEISASQLLDFRVSSGEITERGFRSNISIAVQYLDSWLRGNGAAGINNLMEDAATAEISRSQIWQWVHHKSAHLSDGREINAKFYHQIFQEELEKLKPTSANKISTASELFDRLVSEATFTEFLTLPAYELLD